MAATFRPRRVLVISNETVEADILHDTLVAHADATEVVVVAPALNTRLRHWLSDEDPARRRASERLATTLDKLSRGGVHAEGRVGDADLMLAITDALRTFPADEIVFVGEPEHPHRLARGLQTHLPRVPVLRAA